MIRMMMLIVAAVLSGCAQPLGGTHGDPAARPRNASDAAVSSMPSPRLGGATPTSQLPEAPSPVASANHLPSKIVPDVRAPRTIIVGTDGDVPTIAQAAKLARDGDTVEVKAGEYRGDVAVWTQKRLTIRAIGGRAILYASGKAAEGKGIWVLRNGDFLVDGFDFIGARVPHGNGAGIRFERGSLKVRDSRFIDNQMGLLTGNDPGSELSIDHCDFSGPRDGGHWYHNLYVGSIGRFVMTNSRSHDARVGHLVKSRARENVITDNRLVDGDGSASYELEFPAGGIAIVQRNRIEQSPRTENLVVVSFGAEGYHWPRNELRMSNNELINRATREAIFVRIKPGADTSVLSQNRWAGAGKLQVPDGVDDGTNRFVPLDGASPRASGR